MTQNYRSWVRLLACLFTIVSMLSVQCAGAHPFHISTAEMQFNTKTKRIEVSLKLQALDLERALALLAGKKVNVEKDDVDELVQKYLAQHFYLATLHSVQSPTDGRANAMSLSKVELHGKELETSWLWLYFELEPPAGDEPLALVNTVLIDVIEGQINTVSVRHAGARQALSMTAKKSWGEYSRRWLDTKKP